MSSDQKVKIYSVDTLRSKGAKTWITMFSDLWDYRELIWRLVIRDIKVRYRQSVFGVVWAVFPQIATVALFTFLMKYRVFDVGESNLPYVVHAIWSISVWQLFSSCLISSTKSLVEAENLVTKINFPKEALVIASIGQSILDFVIRLVPIIIVMVWAKFVPSWQAIMIPIILIMIIMMSLGLGFILSILNLVFRDVGNAVSIFLTFGMFLAPILYPPPVREPFFLINIVNPFSPLLIATQELLSGVPLAYPLPFLFMMIFSIILLIVGWRVFHITMPRVTERA